MVLEKLGVKLYAADDVSAPLHEYVPVFHRWIQQARLDSTLIDVVDYRHVHRGPGVMLIGFDFHVAVGDEGGRRGLTVDWKRPLAGEALDKLNRALQVALEIGLALESEAFAGGAPTFRGDRFDVRVNDRALAPNDDPTWHRFRELLAPRLDALFPRSSIRVERDSDPRHRLTARIDVTPPRSLRELRDRIALDT